MQNLTKKLNKFVLSGFILVEYFVYSDIILMLIGGEKGAANYILNISILNAIYLLQMRMKTVINEREARDDEQ
jgi:hypothetical protein